MIYPAHSCLRLGRTGRAVERSGTTKTIKTERRPGHIPGRRSSIPGLSLGTYLVEVQVISDPCSVFRQGL